MTPLAYSHSGVSYLLGYGTDFYGIWHRGRLDQPESSYPRTQEGWSQAWSRFSALEPAAATVSSQAGPIARPGSLAAAGPILIVLGALVLLFGLLILAGSGSVDEFSSGVSQSTVRVLGILTLLQGVLELVAGIRVVGRHKDGRILGIVMVTIGALFSLLGILGAVSGGSPAVLLLGLVFISLRIFVLVTLARTGPAFH